MNELKRRDFLRLGLAAIAAPAVIRCYQTLMPIKAFADEVIISDQHIKSYMLNSEWRGEIVANRTVLIGEEFRMQISDLGIDETFEVLSYQTQLADGLCKIGIRAKHPRTTSDISDFL